jgi:integrase
VKGHIRERSPGRWAIIIDVGDPETGKRRQKWHTFKGTKKQAEVECRKLLTAIDNDTYVDPQRQTVAEFLDRWLGYAKTQVAPRTHERYTELVKKNIVPVIGAVRLQKLRSTQIADLYSNALAGGRRDGKGGLSANTVVYMHRVLKQALKQAVIWQDLARDPTFGIKPPKVEDKQMKALDTDATAELLETARGTQLFIPILLAATTGMRRGEVAALRWRNVDLARAEISVVEAAEQLGGKGKVRYDKPPKTAKGRRTVALSASTVVELRTHRIKHAEDLLKLGIRLSNETFVVAQADGSPYQPRSLTHAFEMFLAKHKLRRIRLHDLRHTHATAMLKAKVNPKIVQERLGHTKISTTLDLYSHVLEGMQEDAIERVDAALQEAINRRQK